MNYLKFTQYAYLLAALLFGIDGFNEYHNGNQEGAYLRFAFTLVGVFMFSSEGTLPKNFKTEIKILTHGNRNNHSMLDTFRFFFWDGNRLCFF